MCILFPTASFVVGSIPLWSILFAGMNMPTSYIGIPNLRISIISGSTDLTDSQNSVRNMNAWIVMFLSIFVPILLRSAPMRSLTSAGISCSSFVSSIMTKVSMSDVSLCFPFAVDPYTTTAFRLFLNSREISLANVWAVSSLIFWLSSFDSFLFFSFFLLFIVLELFFGFCLGSVPVFGTDFLLLSVLLLTIETP